MVLNPANRAALERTGVLVLLTCRPETIMQRLEESVRLGERPLLLGDFDRRVRHLLQEREAVYATIPLQVDTSNHTPERVAEIVLAIFGRATNTPAGLAGSL
jgi:shikimate kinase